MFSTNSNHEQPQGKPSWSSIASGRLPAAKYIQADYPDDYPMIQTDIDSKLPLELKSASLETSCIPYPSDEYMDHEYPPREPSPPSHSPCLTLSDQLVHDDVDDEVSDRSSRSWSPPLHSNVPDLAAYSTSNVSYHSSPSSADSTGSSPKSSICSYTPPQLSPAPFKMTESHFAPHVAVHITPYVAPTASPVGPMVSPKYRGGDPHHVKMAVPVQMLAIPITSRAQYKDLLLKELQWRKQNNLEFRSKVAQKQARNEKTKLQLEGMARGFKARYDQLLEAFCIDSVEKETVHQTIGLQLEQSPQRSATMEYMAQQLVESASKLRQADHSSFYLWQHKVDAFMATMEAKGTLTAADCAEIEVMAIRNLVESEKVTEHLLKEQMQTIKECAHGDLSRLRAECKWWRNRHRHLVRMEQNLF